MNSRVIPAKDLTVQPTNATSSRSVQLIVYFTPISCCLLFTSHNYFDSVKRPVGTLVIPFAIRKSTGFKQGLLDALLKLQLVCTSIEPKVSL